MQQLLPWRSVARRMPLPQSPAARWAALPGLRQSLGLAYALHSQARPLVERRGTAQSTLCFEERFSEARGRTQ